MSFFNDVYGIVKRIPRGKVASYGYVATACGMPRAARQVGWALHSNPDPQNIPCHRVVTKDGKCSEAFAFGGENEQISRLVAEGVAFKDGKVDMEKHALKRNDGY
ncbi:MAG: MGMT family protein [Clostridiales bacterium]|jgi:methylated-DNA-protein-cysteine methyltransferase-like protein|nr:MGMT family protein [Clostridiales bacterium]